MNLAFHVREWRQLAFWVLECTTLETADGVMRCDAKFRFTIADSAEWTSMLAKSFFALLWWCGSNFAGRISLKVKNMTRKTRHALQLVSHWFSCPECELPHPNESIRAQCECYYRCCAFAVFILVDADWGGNSVACPSNHSNSNWFNISSNEIQQKSRNEGNDATENASTLKWNKCLVYVINKWDAKCSCLTRVCADINSNGRPCRTSSKYTFCVSTHCCGPRHGTHTKFADTFFAARDAIINELNMDQMEREEEKK